MSEILFWLILWLFSSSPPPPGLVHIELQNHLGETIIIEPQAPHRCTLTQDADEIITWSCSGPTEITNVKRRGTSYSWVGGGSSGNGPVSGGALGGGWRVLGTQ